MAALAGRDLAQISRRPEMSWGSTLRKLRGTHHLTAERR